jgi:hypothetical protein
MAYSQSTDYALIAKWTAAVIGVALIGVGLLGFIQNPIVGAPDWNPIFVAGAPHNIVHIASGAVALYIAFGLAGRARANALMGFGVLYAVVLVALFIDADLFGLFEFEVNMADHLLHLALAAIPLGVGWMARSQLNDRSVV